MRFLHDNWSDWCVFSSTNTTRFGKIEKNRKQHPPQRDDASTVSAGTCRVGRGEQGAARPAISAPRGEPHIDLGRLRLKTLSKSDFWIAETWPTYLYIYLYVTKNQLSKVFNELTQQLLCGTLLIFSPQSSRRRSSSPTAPSALCSPVSIEGGTWWPNVCARTCPSRNGGLLLTICGPSTTASDHCTTPTSSTFTACGERRARSKLTVLWFTSIYYCYVWLPKMCSIVSRLMSFNVDHGSWTFLEKEEYQKGTQ